MLAKSQEKCLVIAVAADSLRKFSSGPCRNDGANAWEGGVAHGGPGNNEWPAAESVENLGQPLVTYSYSWLTVSSYNQLQSTIFKQL